MEKRFTDLTDEEVRQIVTDMFSPKKITNIKRSKRRDEITCTIYTEWASYEAGREVIDTIADEIELRNPFDYGKDAIWAQFNVVDEDYTKLKQFCFAKGIYGAAIKWLLNNPYMGPATKEGK